MPLTQNPLNPRSGELINKFSDTVVIRESSNSEIVALLKSIDEKLKLIVDVINFGKDLCLETASSYHGVEENESEVPHFGVAAAQ